MNAQKCVCVCVCVCDGLVMGMGVMLSSDIDLCRVFGHFDTPLFLELCKSFQTIHLFKGQKLFSIGELPMLFMFKEHYCQDSCYCHQLLLEGILSHL